MPIGAYPIGGLPIAGLPALPAPPPVTVFAPCDRVVIAGDIRTALPPKDGRTTVQPYDLRVTAGKEC